VMLPQKIDGIVVAGSIVSDVEIDREELRRG